MDINFGQHKIYEQKFTLIAVEQDTTTKIYHPYALQYVSTKEYGLLTNGMTDEEAKTARFPAPVRTEYDAVRMREGPLPLAGTEIPR